MITTTIQSKDDAICDWDEKLHPKVATFRPWFFHKPNAPCRCVIPAHWTL